LKVTAYIIGLNAIQVILFVSTFKTDVILYLMSSMLQISKDYWTKPNDFTTRVGVACTAVISTPEQLYNCSTQHEWELRARQWFLHPSNFTTVLHNTSGNCVHSSHFHI